MTRVMSDDNTSFHGFLTMFLDVVRNALGSLTNGNEVHVVGSRTYLAS